MGYSAFFSPAADDYPVKCIHEIMTGEPCPSCGLSHAFSLILRGRFEEAANWNGAAGGVFAFFAVQLIMRVILAVASLRHPSDLRAITVTDAVLSSLMAIAAFLPFIRSLWTSLVS